MLGNLITKEIIICSFFPPSKWETVMVNYVKYRTIYIIQKWINHNYQPRLRFLTLLLPQEYQERELSGIINRSTYLLSLRYSTQSHIFSLLWICMYTRSQFHIILLVSIFGSRHTLTIIQCTAYFKKCNYLIFFL